MVDFVTARDEICELVYNAWNAVTVEVLGSAAEIRMPRVVTRDPVDIGKHWARVSIQSVASQMSGFGVYADGTKRQYTEHGVLFVQLFAPSTTLTGGEEQDKIASGLRGFFRAASTDSCVRFRHARINDLPSDKDTKQLRINVVADYEYHEYT